MEADIKKMNDAAVTAYMKDISSGCNDYSIGKISAERSNAPSTSNDKFSNSKQIGPKDPFAIPLPEDDAIRAANEMKINRSKAESMWCEAKSDEGYTYYWNIKTGGNNLILFWLLSLTIYVLIKVFLIK